MSCCVGLSPDALPLAQFILVAELHIIAVRRADYCFAAGRVRRKRLKVPC